MFDFVTRLFKPAEKFCTIEGYWCRTPITIDAKTAAQHGGRPGEVTVMVDVDYSMVGDNMRIQRVRLSRKSPNVAAVKRKDAWHANSICSDGELTNTVSADLTDREGFLWRAMMTRWRETFGKSAMPKRAAG